MVDRGGPWEAGGEGSPGRVGKFGRGVGRAPGWAGLTLTATVPAGAERRWRLLSGLPQGCRLIPASWWYFSFFLSGALFFFLIKITMEGSRRLSFTTSQHLGPSSASVGKNVPCHRGCLPLFEVSG